MFFAILQELFFDDLLSEDMIGLIVFLTPFRVLIALGWYADYTTRD
jgi:hypothetical protein